ncbi:unnamed protein product [Linum tenue]|uniref:Uncharacterized protein n=1 Tax=Linum tenue TaxID=586396 RepID=A0AAV0KCK6_9ROSI|nr:unnamed protein product [Linum tenue]
MSKGFMTDMGYASSLDHWLRISALLVDIALHNNYPSQGSYLAFGTDGSLSFVASRKF